MKIDYTVQIWKEEERFIAHAMPIDIASCGSSPEAARLAVDEAVRVFLATAADQGAIKEVLEDAGYHFVSHEWQAPTWMGVEQRTCLATG